MSYMKKLDIRIRSGGDDAIAAACELMPRWIPVSERLPEEDSVVLAFMPEGSELKPEVREMYFVEGEWMNDRGHWPNVTHWMPLPEPPEVK
jgi:hypothetical protein